MPTRTAAEADVADDGRRVRQRTEAPTVRLHGVPPLAASSVDDYRAGRFCDVTICVESERLPAQKSVLCGGSTYFRGLLIGAGSHMGDDSATLSLPEMSAVEAKSVLEWLYTGECEVEQPRLLKVLEASSRLGIGSLQQAAAWTLAGLMDAASCVSLWRAARTLSVDALEQAARNFMLAHFSDVVHEPGFGTLPHTDVADILGSDELSVATEEDVYEALLTWVRAQESVPSDEERASLLEKIRFDRFTDHDFASRTVVEPLLDAPACLRVLTRNLAALVGQLRAGTGPASVEREIIGIRGQRTMYNAAVTCREAVIRTFRAGGELAMELEEGTNRAQYRRPGAVMFGPLSCLVDVDASIPLSIGAIAKRFLSRLETSILLAKTFIYLHTMAPPDPLSRLATQKNVIVHHRPPTTAFAEESHRPPVRELLQFMPDARMCYLDEVLLINGTFEHDSTEDANNFTLWDDGEHPIEATRALVMDVLRKELQFHTILLCDRPLPRENLHAMRVHLYRHDMMPRRTTASVRKIVTPHGMESL